MTSKRVAVVGEKKSAQLGIGTAAFAHGYSLGGDAPSREQCVALLTAAAAEGIRYFDTAPPYGDAESIIGEVSDLVQSHGIRVCTKVARDAAASGAMIRSLEESLRRLRMPSVDTVMVHNADAGTASSAAVTEALGALVSEGLAAKSGASTYGTDDALAVAGAPWCDALQIEHSILNPSVVSAIRSRGGPELVARSVLCKGLLTSRRREASDIARGINATLDSLDRLAGEWGWPLSEMAIRFALDTKGVSVVLVGVTNEAELATAISASRRPPLTGEQLTMMTRFNCADSDATHPERWTSIAGSAA